MSRPMRNDTCWKAPSVLLSAESCMTGDRGAEPKVIDSETTVGIYSLSTHLPSHIHALACESGGCVHRRDSLQEAAHRAGRAD